MLEYVLKITTGRELVAEFFAKWVRIISEYVQKHKIQQYKNIVNSQILIFDHSEFQDAINRDYIEYLPDFAGLVGAPEYKLTTYGKKVLSND